MLDDLGILQGLVSVDDHDDCMCRYASTCGNPTVGECQLGRHATVSPGAYSCGRTTQDEPAMLRDALGCR
jgi:hypothetical protein